MFSELKAVEYGSRMGAKVSEGDLAETTMARTSRSL